MNTFDSLELDPRLLRAVAKMGYAVPTPVQAAAIPLALKGKDIMARARTGSGKTAAYILPILQRVLLTKEALGVDFKDYKAVRALILVPTKELSEQVHKNVKELTVYATKEIHSINIATTESTIANQRPLLQEKPDIIISTPSRILAHLQAGNVNFKESLQSLVIDEADLVLSFGYDEDLRKILAFLPRLFQSYLMSATLSDDVQELKQLILRNPAILKLEEPTQTSATNPAEVDPLTQYYVKCGETDKFLLTYFLLKLRVHPFGTGKSIIFVNDVDRCYKLKLFLEQFGVKSCTLNPELPLKSRHHVVQEFNKGVYDIIIATDEGEQEADDSADEDDGEDDVNEELGAIEQEPSKPEEPTSKVVVEFAELDSEAQPSAENDKAQNELQEETMDTNITAGNKRPRDEETNNDNDEVPAESEVANDETITEPTTKRQKRGPKKAKNRHQKDGEFGVSRGVDFHRVQSVINFDLPISARSYMHRVGRTARGVGNRGWALSFVVPTDLAPVPNLPRRRKAREAAEMNRTVAAKVLPGMFDEDVFSRIEKSQSKMGRTIKVFSFDMEQVNAFKYRVDDCIKAVTKTAIKEARLKEIKQEILNSEKLKAHFEDNPLDLHALRHDKPLHPARIQSHMKHIPEYLMPKKKRLGTASTGDGQGSATFVPFRMDTRKRRGAAAHRGGSSRGGGRGGAATGSKQKDPLKSFKIK